MWRACWRGSEDPWPDRSGFQNTSGEAVRIDTAGGIPQDTAQAAVQVATKVPLLGFTSGDDDIYRAQ